MSFTGWNWGVLMAQKLTYCDVFGMLLKYWLSTEGGFVGGERVNPVGVLVSGGLLWRLVSGVVAGGDMMLKLCSVKFTAVTVAAVMFADCVAEWAAAAVLADVLVLSVVAASAVAMLLWLL